MAFLIDKDQKLIRLPSGDWLDPLNVRGAQSRESTREFRDEAGNVCEAFVKIETGPFGQYFVQCRTRSDADALRDEIATIVNERHQERKQAWENEDDDQQDDPF